jgi:hypothetical protein
VESKAAISVPFYFCRISTYVESTPLPPCGQLGG